MNEEMRTIKIGSWEGPAYLIDGAWYVSPQSIVEHMGLDWVKVRKKIVARFADDIKRIQKAPGMGAQKPVIMSLDVTVQWLAGYAGSNKMVAERRIVTKDMAAAIACQFAAMALKCSSPAASGEIVLLGGSHAQ